LYFVALLAGMTTAHAQILKALNSEVHTGAGRINMDTQAVFDRSTGMLSIRSAAASHNNLQGAKLRAIVIVVDANGSHLGSISVDTSVNGKWIGGKASDLAIKTYLIPEGLRGRAASLRVEQFERTSSSVRDTANDFKYVGDKVTSVFGK
jgi:hypothetical protein